MSFASGLAIYLLFWVMSAFVILPFGVRTHEEAGAERVAGQADSAPHEFRPWLIVMRTTLLASALFALWLANYTYDWVPAATFDIFTPPA